MAPQCVDGLEAALEASGLATHAAAAAEWCERMGPRDLEEIAEEEVFEELAEALKLRPLERRRLRRALGAGAGTGGSTPGGAGAAGGAGAGASGGGGAAALGAAVGGAAAAAPAWPSVRAPPGPTVFVKNTFLDLDEGPRTCLRRLRTEPPHSAAAAAELASLEELLLASSAASDEVEPPQSEASAGLSLEDVELEDEAPAAAGAAAGAGSAVGSPEASPTASPTALPGLYKTVTCDGYEPIGEWSWAGGDPNKPAAVPEEDEEALGAGADPMAPPAGSAGPWHEAAPGPQMVGMVMVPAEAMQGLSMPLAASGMCFPGCVAVPMDRFARWPGELAAAGADAGDAAAAAAGSADAARGTAPGAIAAAVSGMSEGGPKRAQVLQRAFSVASSIYRIRWTVDARKLVSTDREHVSPPFELSFAGPVQFKMIMRPKVMSDEKGGASFKKARGRGRVLLRCLDGLDEVAALKPVVTFRIAVGSGNPAKQAPPRGPVRHDFSEHPICGLPESQQQWDFTKAVDKSNHTFVVCLEVLSGAT